MTAVLTRDQAELLAAYGWQTADMLINPDAGISAAKASDSGAATRDWWWDTDTKGIHAWRRIDDGHPKVTGRQVEVPWSLVRQAAKAVPDRLLSELGAARRRTQREWIRHFPEIAGWVPGGRAAWVEPPPNWHRDAQAVQRAAMVACLDALTIEQGEVAGQLDLFSDAA